MAEKNPAVSVIIPMYNTEKYIAECLESLLNQTLKNFEVIVADDCSTDNSLAIAENMIPAFEKKGLKLFIFTLTKNSACPGVPRNFAIDFAKGKYIYFVDSDDFLTVDALEYFYNVAEEFTADVVHAEKCFEYKEIDGKFTSNIYSMETFENTKTPTLETADIKKRITDFVEKKYSQMVWSKFFRREFLIENAIKFSNITITEDYIFSAMCLACAKKYVRVPSVGYYYRKRADSQTSAPGHSTTISLDLIEGIYFMDNFMQNQKFFIENPSCRYLLIDYFYQIFAKQISKHIFFTLDLDPGEIYSFYNEKVFALNPQKNIPLTTYLFVSSNIYKMLVNHQAAEIAELKKLLQEK